MSRFQNQHPFFNFWVSGRTSYHLWNTRLRQTFTLFDERAFVVCRVYKTRLYLGFQRSPKFPFICVVGWLVWAWIMKHAISGSYSSHYEQWKIKGKFAELFEMALINYKWGWKRRDSSWLFRRDGRVYLIQKCEITAFPEYHGEMRFFHYTETCAADWKVCFLSSKPPICFIGAVHFPGNCIICCVKYAYVYIQVRY